MSSNNDYYDAKHENKQCVLLRKCFCAANFESFVFSGDCDVSGLSGALCCSFWVCNSCLIPHCSRKTTFPHSVEFLELSPSPFYIIFYKSEILFHLLLLPESTKVICVSSGTLRRTRFLLSTGSKHTRTQKKMGWRVLIYL